MLTAFIAMIAKLINLRSQSIWVLMRKLLFTYEAKALVSQYGHSMDLLYGYGAIHYKVDNLYLLGFHSLREMNEGCLF